MVKLWFLYVMFGEWFMVFTFRYLKTESNGMATA